MSASPALRRPLILAAVMAATFMIAIELTIVSTAMPQIVGRLGSLELFSWVFSSFLLAQTATTVVFGKLADLYGRKPVVLAGIAIFVAGSILCGCAWSMPSLILFRLLQGLGAGAIQPLCLTIVADLYPAHERGKIQGYLASVWGVSSVIGPLAGGLIIQHVSWAWIFWINVPIGVAAAVGFVLFLREDIAHRARSVDVLGAALFTVAVAALMVALTEAGTAGRGTVVTAALVCAVSLVLFVVQERRAAEPMVALELWARRPIATANAATLLSGVVMIGLITFLPMYVQAVMGRSALVAGFTLTVMVLGWPIAATIGARNFHRFGLRLTLLFGAALLPLGAILLLFLRPDMSPLPAGAGSLVMGFGLGFLSVAAIVIIQENAGWAERGVATASNIFSRNLGSTLGATVLGAVLNLSLARGGHPVTSEQVRHLLDHGAAAAGDGFARLALGQSLHVTFVGLFLIAALTLVLAMFVPAVAFGPAPGDRQAGG